MTAVMVGSLLKTGVIIQDTASYAPVSPVFWSLTVEYRYIFVEEDGYSTQANYF